jgi:hypothetical protein
MEPAEDAGRGAAAARRRQVALVIAGTLAAGVLVATLGDARGYEALLAARQSQEQQMLGSWTADHGPRFLALEAKSKQKALAALATKHPGDQSSDDDESGVGDVKESVANKLFGAEAGSGGNGHEPPYEVEEDADVGIAVDNFGGDYIAGTDSNDYTDDLENRMVRHRGSIIAAALDPDNADPVIKGYFDTANKKLNMPGIPGGQYP